MACFRRGVEGDLVAPPAEILLITISMVAPKPCEEKFLANLLQRPMTPQGRVWPVDFLKKLQRRSNHNTTTPLLLELRLSA